MKTLREYINLIESVEQGVSEGSVFDIDTTGYTKSDMTFINHDINQIKKIRAKLLKIPGFAKNVKDEAAQLKLAEKIFNLMKRGHTFDSALVLAQKNPGQQGVSEGSGNNDNNDFYSGLYAELLGDVNNYSVTDMVNTKNSIKRALESGRLSLADVKSEIHQLESEPLDPIQKIDRLFRG